MGLFDFFNKKEKKEVLDAGLEKTKKSVFEKLTHAIAGKSTVDDEVLDNLEEVLATSDVGVETTLEIIKRIEERVARDKYVSTKELHNILKEEIAEKKEKVSFKELDAIVASSAMQVPTTYKLDTYVVTSGNTISATAEDLYDSLIDEEFHHIPKYA